MCALPRCFAKLSRGLLKTAGVIVRAHTQRSPRFGQVPQRKIPRIARSICEAFCNFDCPASQNCELVGPLIGGMLALVANNGRDIVVRFSVVIVAVAIFHAAFSVGLWRRFNSVTAIIVVFVGIGKAWQDEVPKNTVRPLFALGLKPWTVGPCLAASQLHEERLGDLDLYGAQVSLREHRCKLFVLSVKLVTDARGFDSR